jgi:hypothetical protein
MSGVNFSLSDAERIARVVRRVERLDNARGNGDYATSNNVPRDRVTRVVRVTGDEDSGNPRLWPGIVLIYDGYNATTDTHTWTELAGSECWVAPGPDDDDLADGDVFMDAVLVGEFSGLTVFSAAKPPGGGGGGATISAANTTGAPTGGTGSTSSLVSLKAHTGSGIRMKSESSLFPSSGNKVLELIDAGVSQKGAISTGDQALAGTKSTTKTFRATTGPMIGYHLESADSAWISVDQDDIENEIGAFVTEASFGCKSISSGGASVVGWVYSTSPTTPVARIDLGSGWRGGPEIASVGMTLICLPSGPQIIMNGSGGITGSAAISGANLQMPTTIGGVVTGWSTVSLSSIVSGGGGLTSIDGSTPTTLTGYVKGNGSVLSAVTTIPWSDLSGVPGPLASTADPLSQFATTTSAELAGVISDETGTGALVFADSPALAGTPTAPTATAGTNTTQLATTAFVRAEVAALIASAPGALDTLDELAAALGDDPNFATTITTALAGKQPLEATLTGIAATAPTADTLIYATGNDVFATTALTSFARSILDDADASAVRATIGAGTVTSITLTQPAAGLTITNSGSALTSSGTRTFALANDLAAVEALSTTGIVRRTAADAWSAGTLVTLAELADLAGLSVPGRAANSTGGQAAITSGGARRFLASDATNSTISFRAPELADLPTPISATTGYASLSSAVSVTSSWANVSGLSLSLPGAGKYVISVTISGTVAFDPGFYGTLQFRIRDTLAGTTLGPASIFITSGPNPTLYYQGVGTIMFPVTVTAASTIDIQGLRTGSGGITFLQSTFDAGSSCFFMRLTES